MLENASVKPVDILLSSSRYRNKTVAAGSAVFAVKRVENEGIRTVRIEAVGNRGIVLRGVQHRLARELDVVKHGTARGLLLVIPVYNEAFVTRVDRRVENVIGNAGCSRRAVLPCPGVKGIQAFVVDKRGVKNIL